MKLFNLFNSQQYDPSINRVLSNDLPPGPNIGDNIMIHNHRVNPLEIILFVRGHYFYYTTNVRKFGLVYYTANPKKFSLIQRMFNRLVHNFTFEILVSWIIYKVIYYTKIRNNGLVRFHKWFTYKLFDYSEEYFNKIRL